MVLVCASVAPPSDLDHRLLALVRSTLFSPVDPPPAILHAPYRPHISSIGVGTVHTAYRAGSFVLPFAFADVRCSIVNGNRGFKQQPLAVTRCPASHLPYCGYVAQCLTYWQQPSISVATVPLRWFYGADVPALYVLC